jgi:hypothetical protein
MAGKRITSRDATYDHVHYNVETRSLYFRSKSGGKGLVFLGVPQEVFYGMPSGANLENFIVLKLQGRYTRVEIPAPPLISYSRINAECHVYREGIKYTYKTRPGEPTSMPDNAEEAFALFAQTYANREPDTAEPET